MLSVSVENISQMVGKERISLNVCKCAYDNKHFETQMSLIIVHSQCMHTEGSKFPHHTCVSSF